MGYLSLWFWVSLQIFDLTPFGSRNFKKKTHSTSNRKIKHQNKGFLGRWFRIYRLRFFIRPLSQHKIEKKGHNRLALKYQTSIQNKGFVRRFFRISPQIFDPTPSGVLILKKEKQNWLWLQNRIKYRQRFFCIADIKYRVRFSIRPWFGSENPNLTPWNGPLRLRCVSQMM